MEAEWRKQCESGETREQLVDGFSRRYNKVNNPWTKEDVIGLAKSIGVVLLKKSTKKELVEKIVDKLFLVKEYTKNETGVLKVLSWNTCGAQSRLGMDNEFLRTCAEEKPDVWVLQEVYINRSFKNLKDQMDLLGYDGHVPIMVGEPIDHCFFVRRDAGIEIENVSLLVSSSGIVSVRGAKKPGKNCVRCAAGMMVIKYNDQRTFIVSVHAPAGSGRADTAARNTYFKQLDMLGDMGSIIRENGMVGEHEKLRIILAGDFNVNVHKVRWAGKEKWKFTGSHRTITTNTAGMDFFAIFGNENKCDQKVIELPQLMNRTRSKSGLSDHHAVLLSMAI